MFHSQHDDILLLVDRYVEMSTNTLTHVGYTFNFCFTFMTIELLVSLMIALLYLPPQMGRRKDVTSIMSNQ